MPAWKSLNGCLWLLWFVGWVLAALATRRDRTAESRASRLKHLGPVFAGAWLLFGPSLPESWGLGWLQARAWPANLTPFLEPEGSLQTLAGLLLAAWARFHLGRYWSGRITLKEGHRLIRTGPYRLVRHPIYAGLLCAFAGSALTLGLVRGVLGLAVISVSFWRKILREERVLHQAFGREYDEYCRRTGVLLPWA
jgi:hypothetical protein